MVASSLASGLRFPGVPHVCQLSQTQLASAAQRNKVKARTLNKSVGSEFESLRGHQLSLPSESWN